MWGSFNSGVVGYFSFVPVLLAERGSMTMARSGALTSLALWVGMLSIPFGGYVAQWFRRPGATIVLFCGCAASALASDRRRRAAVVRLYRVRSGDRAASGSDHVVADPVSCLPAERPAGFGVFYTFHFLLQASGPAIAGWLHDSAGAARRYGFAAAMFVVPLPMLAVFEVLARRPRRTEARRALPVTVRRSHPWRRFRNRNNGRAPDHA